MKKLLQNPWVLLLTISLISILTNCVSKSKHGVNYESHNQATGNSATTNYKIVKE